MVNTVNNKRLWVFITKIIFLVVSILQLFSGISSSWIPVDQLDLRTHVFICNNTCSNVPRSYFQSMYRIKLIKMATLCPFLPLLISSNKWVSLEALFLLHVCSSSIGQEHFKCNTFNNLKHNWVRNNNYDLIAINATFSLN